MQAMLEGVHPLEVEGPAVVSWAGRWMTRKRDNLVEALGTPAAPELHCSRKSILDRWPPATFH